MKRRCFVALVLHVIILGSCLRQLPLSLAGGPNLPIPSLKHQPIRARDSTRHLMVNGLERTYLLDIPSGLDISKPTPVILAFHGGGSSARQMANGFDISQKGGQAGYIVIYADGYKRSWNAGPGPDGQSPNWGPAFKEGIDDVAFVSALLADLATVVEVDPRRIYATGISNGSAMAYRLACELSDRIVAVAGVVSEVSVPDCKPSRPVPIMHFWGTADPIRRPGAPPAAERTARHIATWLRLNGCTQEQVTYKKGAATRKTYTGCRQGAEVILWTVEGMGHTWPGVCWRPWTQQILGLCNKDISATEEMLKFFLAHPPL
jgi:polyhydroxybutyrate depolymerase